MIPSYEEAIQALRIRTVQRDILVRQCQGEALTPTLYRKTKEAAEHTLRLQQTLRDMEDQRRRDNDTLMICSIAAIS